MMFSYSTLSNKVKTLGETTAGIISALYMRMLRQAVQSPKADLAERTLGRKKTQNMELVEKSVFCWSLRSLCRKTQDLYLGVHVYWGRHWPVLQSCIFFFIYFLVLINYREHKTYLLHYF